MKETKRTDKNNNDNNSDNDSSDNLPIINLSIQTSTNKNDPHNQQMDEIKQGLRNQLMQKKNDDNDEILKQKKMKLLKKVKHKSKSLNLPQSQQRQSQQAQSCNVIDFFSKVNDPNIIPPAPSQLHRTRVEGPSKILPIIVTSPPNEHKKRKTNESPIDDKLHLICDLISEKKFIQVQEILSSNEQIDKTRDIYKFIDNCLSSENNNINIDNINIKWQPKQMNILSQCHYIDAKWGANINPNVTLNVNNDVGVIHIQNKPFDEKYQMTDVGVLISLKMAMH
jgi:hypothetical protein